MRISTRLAKLEQSTSTGSLSVDATKMLVRLLGARDALFYPWRSQGPHRVAVHQRQRRYLSGEQGLSAKADGRAQWKESHFLRSELVGRCHVIANRSGGQITTLFISPSGESFAQSLVWNIPQAQVLNEVSRALFDRVRDFEVKLWCGRKWLSESQLFDTNLVSDPDQWSELTSLTLPLLVHGLVIANSDAYGRVYYSPTGKDFPVELATHFELQQAEPTMTTVYLDAYGDERQALMNAEPYDGNEILIPIPASGW